MARLAANEDDESLADYDAIVAGCGRSTREIAQTLEEIDSHLGEATSRLLFFAPQPEALEQALLLNSHLAQVPRAQNFQQLTLLMSAVLPGAQADHEPDQAVRQRGGDNAQLAGAKVLIVDDDIRNIYSLTSVLETYNIQVLHAERGAAGIEILEQTPDVDVALIDIMMPDMDGYETMREIRRRPATAHIPLISVTAKAMKGDRQKSLEAGASDYIAKPVDLELLLALLRVWVTRSRSRFAREDARQLAAAMS
jgi:CheY-like chemotaxis protein